MDDQTAESLNDIDFSIQYVCSNEPAQISFNIHIHKSRDISSFNSCQQCLVKLLQQCIFERCYFAPLNVNDDHIQIITQHCSFDKDCRKLSKAIARSTESQSLGIINSIHSHKDSIEDPDVVIKTGMYFVTHCV